MTLQWHLDLGGTAGSHPINLASCDLSFIAKVPAAIDRASRAASR